MLGGRRGLEETILDGGNFGSSYVDVGLVGVVCVV